MELIEIGAGGGSIARLDELNLLKAGPDSAGAAPGPIAYNRGGEQPTVTDADFALGYLSVEGFAGGEINVDLSAARSALAALANKADLSPNDLAWGVHDLVNENMASAARVHIAEKGRDPRSYTLVATGGAGPVHAYYMARKLGIKKIICPRNAGVASAFGLLLAPARVDRTTAFAANLEEADWWDLEAQFTRLEEDARQVIADTNIDAHDAVVQRLADLRNVGQGFELVVSLPNGPYDKNSHDDILAAYKTAYQTHFTRPPPNVPVAIAALRVRLTAPTQIIADDIDESDEATTRAKASREIYIPELGGLTNAVVFDRSHMAIGEEFHGPAVVEEAESTALIGPGGRFHISKAGNLIIDLPARQL